jgi:hypothetical protein
MEALWSLTSSCDRGHFTRPLSIPAAAFAKSRVLARHVTQLSRPIHCSQCLYYNANCACPYLALCLIEPSCTARLPIFFSIRP